MLMKLRSKVTLHDFAASIPVGILVINSSEEVVYVNPSAEKVFERSIPDSGIIRCGDFFSCANKEENEAGCGHSSKCPKCPLLNAIRTTLSKSEQHETSGETQIDRTDDFDSIWVKYQARKVEIGKQDYLILTVDDISDRKKVENKLQETVEQYHSMANCGNAMIWTSGPDMQCNYFSNQWLNFTGRSSDQELGEERLEGVHPDDQDAYKNTYSEAFNNRESFVMTYRMRRHDGNYRWLKEIAGPRWDEKGTFIGYIGHCYDVTERIALEDSLEEREQSFQFIAENTSDGIIVIENGVITYASPAYFKILGYPESSEVGRTRESIIELLHPDDREGVLKTITNAIELKNAQAIYAYRARAAGGSFVWREDHARFIYGNDGKYQKAVVVCRDISERKRMEHSLKSAADYTRRIFDSIDACIAVIDKDWKIHDINSAWRDFALANNGNEDEHCWGVGASYYRECPSHSPDYEYADQAYAGIAEVLRGDCAVFQMDYPCDSLRDNRWFSLRASSLRGEYGMALISHTDITARKKLENNLKVQVARNTAILQALPDMLFRISLAGYFIDAHVNDNDSLLMPLKEFVGKHVEDVLDPHLADTTKDMLKKVVLDPTPQEYHYSLSILGEIRHYEARMVISGIEEAMVIIRDITRQRHVEEERNRLISVIEQTTEMVMMTDLNWIVQHINPAFEQTTGYSAAEIVGKDLRRLHQQPQDITYFEQIKNTLDNGQVWNDRFVEETKTGTLLTEEVIFSSLENDDGKIVGYLAIKKDITAKLQKEEEFRQAQKMESVGRLAGGISHDFNNMLTIILGNIELAFDDLKQGATIQGRLEEIQSAAQRSADITRQLLAFARKQTIAPKVLDLNHTLENILKILQRLIGEDIDLVWHPEESLWPVRIDPAQIDQILANLCVNARDAIVDVGKITIKTGNITFDDHYCKQHSEFTPGEYVMLAVSDNGCGMDSEDLEKIFEPFYTTKESGKGTGLGLSTVYGAVKQNQGFINVYSETDQGTTFKIYLPRYEAMVESFTGELNDKLIVKGQETILLVEDESAILSMTNTMLERLGYQVLAADTPGEALRLVQENDVEIQMLISDVIMPEMNGCDLAKNLLSLYPNLRCLFMSGYTTYAIAHHGVLEDGVNFINKPFSHNELGVKVREALDKGEP